MTDTTERKLEDFGTGAVREAVDYRFDLCSPDALDELFFWKHPDVSLLKRAIKHIYDGEYSDAAFRLSQHHRVSTRGGGVMIDCQHHVIDKETAFAYARAMHEGASKYGERNWENGIPKENLINHAIAHVVQLVAGDTSEPHFDHAVWNLMTLIHFEETGWKTKG